MFGVLLAGGALGTFLLAGKLWPREPQPFFHKGMFLNLANGLLLFGFRVTVVRWAEGYFDHNLIDMSVVPWGWAQFLIAFLVLDFSRYWLHRMGHRVPFLWQFHRVHHSVEEMDATAGLRMHLVDFIQLSLVPMILFGVLMDTASFDAWVIPAAMGVGVFFDHFQHANLRFDLSKPWNALWHRFLNNPHFHSWHHTREGHVCDGNYSNTIIIWDRLFGSEVTRETTPELYGVSGDQRIEESLIGFWLLRPRKDKASA